MKVKVGQSLVYLSGGEELIVSNKKLSASSFSTMDKVGRRNATLFPLSSRYAAMTEFSIPSLISCTPYMAGLVHPTSEKGRQFQDCVLKTAAALQFATRHKGAYKSAPAVSMVKTNERN